MTVRTWHHLAAAAFASLSLSPTTSTAPKASSDAIPPVVLWAWERPTDLREIPRDVGVAFLTQTIHLDRTGVRVQPRRQALHVAATTPLVAVTRIERAASATVPADASALRSIADQIARSATWPQVVAVQIDFDATASDRSFYRRLVHEVRRRVDAATPLSVTALASWCAGDRWLEGLPIDEAVPMLFQMGTDDEAYAAMAASPRRAAPACRGAVGLSLDEPMAVGADSRRLYVFNPDAWTATSVSQAMRIR